MAWRSPFELPEWVDYVEMDTHLAVGFHRPDASQRLMDEMQNQPGNSCRVGFIFINIFLFIAGGGKDGRGFGGLGGLS